MSKDEIEKKSIIQNNSKEKIEIKKIRIKFEKKKRMNNFVLNG
jgi:hypothetical protein